MAVIELVCVGLLVFFSSIVATTIGFGYSTTLTPLLLLFLPLNQAVLFVAITHLFGDVWKFIFFAKGFNISLFLSFGLASIVFSFLGAQVLFFFSLPIFSHIFGCFIVVYLAYLWYEPQFKLPANYYTGIFGGALSGFSAGLFGISGAIRALFLVPFNLPKSTYLSTVGLIAFMTNVSRIFVYVSHGVVLKSYYWWGLFFFVPASFVGAFIGKIIVEFIPREKFRKLVISILLLLGIKLLLFGL